MSTQVQHNFAFARESMKRDPFRPTYHFLAPFGWMNDLNAPIFYNGEYHLFYQWEPESDGAPNWEKICWGHASSPDLVHWKDWPIALKPDTSHDCNGAYSGNMVINDTGIPSILYTGNVGWHAETYGILAQSFDDMKTWQKQMVMKTPPYPQTPVHWDAQIWKHNNEWFQLIGGTTGTHGAAYLWSSPDLTNWTFRNCIFSDSFYGDFWEFPYLLPFGDQHVLIVGLQPLRYWIGVFNQQTLQFSPHTEQAQILEPACTLYAPNCHLTDNKTPNMSTRRLMFGWIRQGSPMQNVAYWEGVCSLPRVLSVENNILLQEPAPELQKLRLNSFAFTNIEVGANEYSVQAPRSKAFECLLEFQRDATANRTFEIHLCDGSQNASTLMIYNEATHSFFITGGVSRQSDVPAWTEPIALPDTNGNRVTIHFFFDASVLEIFVAGHAFTERLFPENGEVSIQFKCHGKPLLIESLRLWSMKSIW